ncbi:MAG: response regulator [Agriterribacter sp.]
MSQIKTIIIVDDDAGIVKAIEIMLQFEGYAVSTCNSTSVIPQIQQHPPHLILLDLWMPVTNGNEICKKLKADDATRHLPVILMSASTNIKQIAMECGADDFLEKPFELKDLIQKVKDHIL